MSLKRKLGAMFGVAITNVKGIVGAALPRSVPVTVQADKCLPCGMSLKTQAELMEHAKIP